MNSPNPTPDNRHPADIPSTEFGERLAAVEHQENHVSDEKIREIVEHLTPGQIQARDRAQELRSMTALDIGNAITAAGERSVDDETLSRILNKRREA